MKIVARTLRKRQTPQEIKLWKYLRGMQLNVKFRRQYLIADTFIADFVCLEKKLIIEVDGSQHAQQDTDVLRTRALQQMGFKVLRFWNTEIDQQLPACLEVIRQFVL